MAKSLEKQKAIELRKRGLSINEICREIGVSKSSVSIWTSDIVLSKEQLNRIHLKIKKGSRIGRIKGSLTNKNKKLNLINENYKISKKEIVNISQRDLLFLTVGLFWAEGNKTGSRFIFVNTDYEMIKIIIYILKNKFKINDFSVSIQINHEHKDRTEEIKKYWIKKLKITDEQFKNIRFIKTFHKKVYKNRSSYYGTCVLYVHKSSILQYKFLGYIRAIKDIMSM